MRGDILVLDAGDAVQAAKAIRNLTDEQLADVQPVDLDRAARLLHAAAYSSTTAARRLDRLVFARAREVAACAETP